MAKASDNQFPGIIIRESANDGSDFSNPSADYRRLFLGEDGQLHVKDSAGTVTDIGGSSGGVATDAIWDAAGDLVVGSGSNTAARLALGAVGGNVGRVNGAVAWTGGTAFPTPATGDRFYRSDLGMEFFYDGTRWLSTQLFTSDGSVFDLAASDNGLYGGMAFDEAGPDYWLEDLEWGIAVATTNDGTHNWLLRPFTVLPDGSGGTGSAIVTVNSNTVATGADNYTGGISAINAVLDVSASPGVRIVITKQNSPGTLRAQWRLTYRRIGV